MLQNNVAFCTAFITLFSILFGAENSVAGFAALFSILVFRCAYLLLQGYDVSGEAYSKRLAGLFVGAVITAAVFYRNHRKKTYKRTLKSLFQEFNLSSTRTKWQLRFIFTISSVMLIASLLNSPKAVWVGISAMSVCVPFRNDVKYRVKYRILGNILGSIIFFAAYLLPLIRGCLTGYLNRLFLL